MMSINIFKIKSVIVFLIFSGFLIGILSCSQDLPQACMRVSTDLHYVDSTIHFENCSVGADKYLWRFGDSITSMEFSPVHSYSLEGEYQVSLVSETDSKSDSVYYLISIIPVEN